MKFLHTRCQDFVSEAKTASYRTGTGAIELFKRAAGEDGNRETASCIFADAVGYGMNGESWSLLAKLGLLEVGCGEGILAAFRTPVRIPLK